MSHPLAPLLDHVHIRVADLEASRRFYTLALAPLGRAPTWEGEHAFELAELFVSDDGLPTARLHLAFRADGPDRVAAFHRAALAAGGVDNGAPGERPRYHPGYYSAYVLDPDGNNVEAVFHGRA